MIEQVVNALIANETIKEKDKALYSFGLRQGIIILSQTMLVFLVGVLLDMWWQSIVFTCAYIPLRLSAGGTHANKLWLCFICTLLHTAIVLFMIKLIVWTYALLIFLLIVFGCIIFLLAPIENKNKPFDKMEYKIFLKRTRIALLFETMLIIMFLVFGLKEIAACVCISICSLAISVVIGCILNSAKGMQGVRLHP